MMLRLELLGGFRAYTEDGEAAALAKQPRRAALLAFLALERDVSRGKVVSVLWPEADSERARHSLNQGIYSLRRIVGTEWIELRGDRCVVAPWVSTDVEELERAAAAGDQQTVLTLYQGPLLAGVPVGVTADFDVWLAHRRSALERLHRAARRQRLAELLSAPGSEREALLCAETWCRLEPLEDEAHHHYIQLLAETGQRGAALEHFRSYARLLEEQGLAPLDETLTLVAQLQHGEVGTLPAEAELPRPPHGVRVVESPAPPPGPPPRSPPSRWRALLDTRVGLMTLLAAVSLFNLLETTAETWLSDRFPGVDARRLELARAAHWLERGYSFEHHELAGTLAIVGFSSAYFFVFPLLLLSVAGALARRSGLRPFRVFALAAVFNYLICLPFFVFFPVPERWWFSESGAVLLSDLWSVYLIELIRPFSALDNSFPSMHVSLTVVAVITSFLWRLRYRWSVLFLGGAVVLSTVALGIHWLPDLLAGAAAGVIGVALALRADAWLAEAWPQGMPAAARRPAEGLAAAGGPGDSRGRGGAMTARFVRIAVAAIAGALALPATPAPAAAQAPITFLEVALDEDTRRADEKLRRYLALETGAAFVAERPLEYGAIVDRLASWPSERGDFVARMTPYAFVAAEMLGAKLDVLATYVSAATGATTYHSYFVVSRERFREGLEPASVVEYLRELGRPASFAYHSKFSTSSYFLPAFFFRSSGVFNMPESTPYHTAIHTQELGGSSADLVRAVVEGRSDLAAVWDGTKTRFEEVDSLRTRYGERVHFIQLPTRVPNDLLVASAMDAGTRDRILEAIQKMAPDGIAEGDFQSWVDINSAREAREALANLRWLAREQPPAVTVDVRLSDAGGPLPDLILDAARQAVRLSATELVNYDGDFHAHSDYLWTIERVRDGTITLSSRIIGSNLEDQRFRISFNDPEDLTRRIGGLIHSRLHRIRYVWPYRPERPTLIRDVDFSLPAGSAVRVRRIRWLDVQRNHFQEDAEFEALVQSSDFYKIELGPAFVAPAEAGFGFDPMSNISYRVVLIRPAAQSPLFRVLTGGLVFLLVGAAGAFGVAARRHPLPESTS